MTHALIVGSRGVGKSTLIRRLLQELDRPVCGFETKKENAPADDALGSPTYIYPVGEPRRRTEENLLGRCKAGRFDTRPGAFDRFAPVLLRPVPAGAVLLFDELGFMESREKAFCNAVLSRLDGDTLVIAAVKDKDLPFLEAVRSHPKCRCFHITRENRDELYDEVLRFVREQLGGCPDRRGE